jgi:ribosome biogenesis GTPase / thiamine phosphate phosphatase
MRLAMIDRNTGSPANSFAPAGAWDGERELEFSPLSSESVVPGRVIAANRNIFLIKTAHGLVQGIATGRLLHELNNKTYPVVGDWTAVDVRGTQAAICHLLSRRSFFSRQTAGKKAEEQVVAANVDFAFIALGLDRDYSLKRLDRYLVQASSGHVQPVVLLTKADLCRDLCGYLARTEYELGSNVKVHAISAIKSYGLSDLDPYLQPGITNLLIGSSGVGKSTLINQLIGEGVAATGAVRERDGRGRCTTTGTRAFAIRDGAWLIDSPGMREVQLWANDANFDRAFSDIQALAANCRFRDCAHQGEPDCAIQAALSQDQLTQERFLNYMKLRYELSQTKEAMQRARRKRSKEIAVLARRYRRIVLE